MLRPLAVWTVLLSAGVGLAQQRETLKWTEDARQAIDEAKRENKPIMFYVLGRSEDRDDDIERDQKRAFADPLVNQLARRFVTSKLSRSRYADLLEKWSVPRTANMWIVFSTPAGDAIGEPLDSVGASKADSLAQRMSLVFKAYRNKIFNDELKPVLESDKAASKDLLAALKRIEELTILDADDAVIALAKRSELDPKVAARAYEVLAELSTGPAVKLLLEQAVESKDAAAALRKCTPGGAEQMLPALEGDDAGSRLIAYEAAGRICKVANLKQAKFWEGTNERVKTEELERVRDAVRKAAAKWKDRYEEYR